MSQINLKTTDKGILFFAKIVPGSSRDQIAGSLDGMLKVKISAPPENGKANKALIAFLAKNIGVRKNDITILSGHTSPVKEIEIRKITSEDFLEVFNLKIKRENNQK